MGALINVTIDTPAAGDVQLDANSMFQVQGSISPADPGYTVRAYLVYQADNLTVNIPGTMVQVTANSYHFAFTVDQAARQNVSLFLIVVVTDGNDSGGQGISIRCIPQP